ncbi:DUF397 domain-containing protein [Streptomyces exfoliatus]|uniref:DUF397 domain-containing protein n=1 Tax=Streptomyces exfoliatus TaxID=1905 RepID=UPI0004B51203|nr:DUF397 domain-containing protein [Streptomyces exfoliatus]
MQHDPAEPTWRSSSYSSGNGQCVQVRDDLSGTVPVRDSKTAPAGPCVFFEAAAWASFVGAVKAERL